MRPWQLVLLILVIAGLAFTVGWQPFWLLTYVLTTALLLSAAWVALSLRGITFSRTQPEDRIQVGERISENLALENHSVLPKPWVQVADLSTLPGHHAGYVSSIGPRQRISWSATTTCRRRGRYQLGPVTLTTGDPLGLFRHEEVLAAAREVLVLPVVLPLSRFDIFQGYLPGRGRGSQRSLQTTTNVVTVRQYVPGDALTRIHWPTTARQGHFMVKEFDLDPTVDVHILLDLDQDTQAGEDTSSTEEYGVTLAASIADFLLQREELAVALNVNGATAPSIPYDRGQRQRERILETLALAHADERSSLTEAFARMLPQLGRNTVLVLITASSDLVWPQAMTPLQRRGVRPTVLLLDPHSFDAEHGSTTRVHDALVAAGVPVITIRKGDPLVQVLEQGAS